MAGCSDHLKAGALALLLFLYSVHSWSLPLTALVLWFFNHLAAGAMDAQAEKLLEVLRAAEIDVALKIDLTNKLKAYIKHHSVPASALANSFECIRICLSKLELCDVGFSTLSHLSKRVIIQKQQSILAYEGSKTFDILLDRLGDSKERVQQRAGQAFIDFWSGSPQDVETFIRDEALTTKNARAKKASLQWIVQVHNQFSLQFRGFVPAIISCLEDSDNSVRETASSTITELFQNAPQHAKADLQKQLDRQDLWKTMVDGVGTKTEIRKPLTARKAKPASVPAELPATTSPPSRPKTSQALVELPACNPPPAKTTSVVAGSHPTTATSSLHPIFTPTSLKNDLKPIVVEKNLAFTCKLMPANRDTTIRLDDCYDEMSPSFEGTESEKNWLHREANIIILRRLTKGNAPTAFTNIYIVQVKALLDGIIKAVNSLRTSLSTHGCLLIQEATQTVGPGLDPMVEIILQPLLKLCGNTKSIAAQNANTTISIIFSNVTYSHRQLQHIWNSCQEKNVRPRGFAPLWLKTIITKHQHHSNTLEHANGLDLIEKILQRGLGDSDPGVRQNARDVYWTFWSVWPARADSIMQSLKRTAQNELIQHSSNPGVTAPSTSATSSTTAPVSRPITPHASHPSLKETMAANRKKKAAVERPESSLSTISTKSTANMSSAPKRPTKAPAKKVEARVTKTTTPRRPPSPEKSVTAQPSSVQETKATTPIETPNLKGPITPELKHASLSRVSSRSSIRSRSSSKSDGSAKSVSSIPRPSSFTRPRSSGQEDSAKATDKVGPIEQVTKSFPSSRILTPNRSRSSTTSSQKSAPAVEKVEDLELANKKLLASKGLTHSRSSSLGKEVPMSEKITATEQSSSVKKQAEMVSTQTTPASSPIRVTFDSFAYQKARKTLPTMSESRMAIIARSIIASLNSFDPSRDDSRLLSQQLLTLREMSKMGHEVFLKLLPDSVCAILGVLSRRGAPPAAISALHECLDDLLLVREKQEDCVRVVATLPQSEHVCRTLGKLVGQVRSDLFRDSLQASLMGMVEEGISDVDAGSRKAATELGLALYVALGDELTFWKAAPGLSGEKRDLLMYYINRANRVSAN